MSVVDTQPGLVTFTDNMTLALHHLTFQPIEMSPRRKYVCSGLPRSCLRSSCIHTSLPALRHRAFTWHVICILPMKI